jgi:hypothetical protein
MLGRRTGAARSGALIAGCLAVAAALVPGAPASATGTGPVIKDASMYNGGYACSTRIAHPAKIGFTANELDVAGSDADPDVRDLTYRFQIWPKTDPAAITSMVNRTTVPVREAYAIVLAAAVADATTYTWRVRVSDANGRSKWSHACVFRTDLTPPSIPTVESPNYPEGQWGPNTLTVAATDRAGRYSPAVKYDLFAPADGPSITVHGGAVCGATGTFRFAPNDAVTNVVAYRYWQGVGNVTPVRVDARADGTARVTVPAGDADSVLFSAQSISANGFRSTPTTDYLRLNATPAVSSDVYLNSGSPVGGVGTLGTFTFSPPGNSAAWRNTATSSGRTRPRASSPTRTATSRRCSGPRPKPVRRRCP